LTEFFQRQATQINVPTDIGVISFDDNTHFDLFTPSITSIAQPISEIADTIMRLLLLQLNGDQAPRAHFPN
jgi:LacI family transcriptional regulator